MNKIFKNKKIFLGILFFVFCFLFYHPKESYAVTCTSTTTSNFYDCVPPTDTGGTTTCTYSSVSCPAGYCGNYCAFTGSFGDICTVSGDPFVGLQRYGNFSRACWGTREVCTTTWTCAVSCGSSVGSCVGGATCTAGTGSTPASCGGHESYQCTAYSTSGGTCCDYTYRCSGSSCVSACHVGVAVSNCGGCCSAGYSWNGSTCVAASNPNCDTGASCGACSNSCGAGTQSCTYTTYTGGGACTPTSFSQGCSGTSCTPNCDSGISCGACNLSSGTCGTGSQSCTYTTYTGGGTCTPVGAQSQSCSVGCSSGNTCNNGTCIPSIFSITGNVYNDFNGNGVKDASDTNHSGLTVGLSNGATTTSNANGNYTFSNLSGNTYTITLTVPSGYSAITTNPVTGSYVSSTTVNFGIQPPAPTCSGGLTANPTTVSPGGSSTLTAVGCTSSAGGGLTYTYYDDSTISGDSVTNNNTNTSTWTAPATYWTQVIAHPSVSVCNPSGGLCTGYTTISPSITITPLFSISGSVFVDDNNNQIQDGAETTYSGAITIAPSGGTITYPNLGTYQVGGLTAGTYTVSFTGLPTGYQVTYPLNGPPPSFSVTVGPGCSVQGSNSASCN